jgi:hypothetical protein
MDLKNTLSFITLSFFVAFSLHGKVHIDSSYGKANIDSLLHVLDKTIREEQAYDEQKEYQLFVLKDGQLAYLLHEGDVNRANSYIKKSMEDAN